MSDEREFYHLQEQDDAAADWQPEGGDWDIDPTPLAYPEWNRRRTEAGLPAGTFTEYLSSIGGFSADNAPDDREWPAHPYEETN